MDDRFIVWNQIGLIPGPQESEEEYLKRALYCLDLQKFPLKSEDRGSQEVLKEAFTETKSLYDITPDWIPVFFTDYQLPLWHGGSAWIFQEAEDSPTAAVLQLRQKFKSSPTYLGIYSRKELLAHEIAHVGRMVFEEPIFEEFHAYRSSESPFRRYFGPVLKSAKESVYFLLILLLIFIIDASLIATENYTLYTLAMYVKGIPLLMILLALFRLIFRKHQYERCYKTLKACSLNPNAVIYRLTDQEIISFGKMSQKELLKYIQEEESLRWKLIRSEYFATTIFS